ncbi:MAG TPA: TetR/AcrR family transcriptional regulator [bacterium]|nr:TetR/AcrR family transcriptional regulator [bacterium]
MPRLSTTAREVRTGERRGQILRAALDVFSRRGFHGATIREIASTAGLAEGTIYLYFASKQDVLRGVIGLIAEDGTPPDPVEFPAGDDEAFLNAFVLSRVRTLARHASFIRLVVHEADLHEDLRRELFRRLHDPFVGRFRAYLDARIAAGAFRPVNTDIAASICFRMVMSYLMTQHVLGFAGVRYNDDEYLGEMVALMLRGLVVRDPQRRAAPGSATTETEGD